MPDCPWGKWNRMALRVWAQIVGMGLAAPLLFGQTGRTVYAPLKVPSGSTPIQHIVFIIKENRSFDNYFGTFPGANGATSGTISTGQVIPLGHTPDVTPNDPGHG